MFKEKLFTVNITNNTTETPTWFGFDLTQLWSILVIEHEGSLFCPINIHRQIPLESGITEEINAELYFDYLSNIWTRCCSIYPQRTVRAIPWFDRTKVPGWENLSNSQQREALAAFEAQKKKPPQLGPFGSHSGFCKISCNKDGSFKTELVHNLDLIALKVLREIPEYNSLYISIGRFPYDSNSCIWNSADRQIEQIIQQLEWLHLRCANRLEVPIPKAVSNSSENEKRALTYGSRNAFEHHDGDMPLPRANSFVTYIAKGEYYVLYGGLIPMSKLPQQKFDEILEYMKHSAEHFRNSRVTIRAALDRYLYLSDAVWKYHIVQDKWELALPDTKRYTMSKDTPFLRPRGQSMMEFHHEGRKKIYYFCREFDTDTCNCLFEYDYQINKFKRIELSYTIRSNQVVYNGVIDFSNDTLLLSVRDTAITSSIPSILVFCFDTHKSTWIKLSNNKNRKEGNTAIMQRIGLADNYKKLVFIPNEFRTSDYKHLASVDWADVKRRKLDHLLNKFRGNLYGNDKRKKQLYRQE